MYCAACGMWALCLPRALLVCWLAALLTGKAGNFTTERYAVTISTSPGFESRQD